jgi:hypothetical protein
MINYPLTSSGNDKKDEGLINGIGVKTPINHLTYIKKSKKYKQKYYKSLEEIIKNKITLIESTLKFFVNLNEKDKKFVLSNANKYSHDDLITLLS